MKKINTAKVLLKTLTGCTLSLLLSSCANAQQSGTNIALGKTVTFNAAPNYALCTDPGDNTQLTDGMYDEGGDKSLWEHKGTVGWQSVSPVITTIDLGSEQPISGASLSTAANAGGVTWPSGIYIAVSNDNKTWHEVGNLVEMSRKNGLPPAEDYAAFRYVTHELKTHGRYIAFAVANAPYIFMDEIEVYAGEKQWLSEPVGGQAFQDINSIEKYVGQNQTVVGAIRRMKGDANAVRALVQAANIPAMSKSTFFAQLKDQETAIDALTTLPDDFKVIVPFNEEHQKIFAVYGELLAAQGLKPLTVWKQHRYAWLPLLAKPVTTEKPELHFSMLKNQFRSDALFFTNAGTEPQNVTLKLSNAPEDAQQNWFKVDSVEWTDTHDGAVVADALIPVEAKNGVYSVMIPAGMTRKVWFTVDSSKVAEGNSKSTLEVSSGVTRSQVPVTFDISSLAMKKPRISLGMWDYTNGNGYSGITPQNRAAAIDMMRSHFVNSPWATNTVLPFPSASNFDAHGNLSTKLNFSELDNWIKMWPGAQHYFVFAYVSDHFANAAMGSAEFDARVGSWAKVLSAHMKELGLQPEQLGLLLVDEPLSDAQDAIIAAWAKAIKAAAPELTLFEDPNWLRPDQTKIQDAVTQIDVLCLNLPIYYRGEEPVQKYFANLRNQGKQLWLYQCTGPVRTYDPQTYFRYQAWHTYAIGGTGQGFWSFGETGNAPSSWNEYPAGGVNFAPAFLDKNTVYNSIHWDAVREGMEDFEELSMLQDAIKKSNNAALKSQAQKVLDDAVKAVVNNAGDNTDYSWPKATDPFTVDTQLAKVQNMLAQF